MRRTLVTFLVVGVVCGMGLAFGVGWGWGRFTQAHREADRRFREDSERFAPVLGADPALRRLQPFDFPVTGFSLGGPVPTQSDLDRLRGHVTRVFGEARAGHI